MRAGGFRIGRSSQRLGALLLCGAVVAGPFAAGSAAAPARFPCSVPGQITPHPFQWHSIRGPSFPSGPQVIASYAVEPLRPSHLYVSNGVSVMRSVDTGCTWQQSYALPAGGGAGGANATAGDSEILEIEVSAPGVLYLPIQQSTTAGPRPRVLVSTDAGASWRPAEGGILAGAIGRLEDFDAPLGDPGKAYALIDLENTELPGISVDASQVLIETNDSGTTWTNRIVFQGDASVSTPVGGVSIVGAGEFRQITADPVRSEEVWLYGEGETLYAGEAGLVPIPLRDIGTLDIAFDGSMVLAYELNVPTGHLSVDGGETFTSFQTGVAISSAAAVTAGGFPPLAAAEGSGRSFFHSASPGAPGMQLWDITPFNGRRISSIKVGIEEEGPNGLPFEPLVFGHTSDTIEVMEYPVFPEVPPPPVTELVGNLDFVSKREPGVLVPEDSKLTLRPGKSKTIPYGLTVPAASTPLDVYFMIDVSGSMGGTINGVRSAMQEIVDRLADLGADVNFGVGSFRAYNDPPAYARLRDIGPVNDELRRALNSLNASGGGAETQMSALYQSVTGEGEAGIPPDLNMNFRPGSLRVSILATDEQISKGGAHKPYPTVVEALKKADVKSVGLAIQESPFLGEPDYDDPGEPADILQKVATGSGALAPAGGVDCDGEAGSEIPEGGPIVCIIPPGRASEADLMADAIVNVLNAVEDIQDVGVSVGPTEASARGAIDELVIPEAFPALDLKREQNLEFRVTVRCPRVDDKTTYPMDVRVGTDSLGLGSTTLVVTCDPKTKKEPPPPIVPAFVPLLALPFPPIRPPEPIPEPNPNPQPNPQSNPQAQSGLVQQEQKQQQLAAVHQESQMLQPESEEAGGQQFLMTQHKQSQGLQPGAVFVTGAVLMTLLYGFATMRREQVRTQRQSRRPWD